MNIPFIKYLGEKLKTGSLRSIHLNALPNRYLTRLDITKLDLDFFIKAKSKSKNPKLPSHKFLFENLLKKEEFKFVVNFKGVKYKDLDKEQAKQYNFVYRRMSSLFNQAEDNYLEHGVKTFSFGYPILVKRSKADSKRIIKAPIFIWSLELKRSRLKWNEWTIVKSADAPIYINEVLISHIAQDEGILMDNLRPEYLEDGLIDTLEMAEIVNEVINHFRKFESKIRPELEPFPSAPIINEQSATPFIQWSGVFGLFKTQKQSIIKDIEELANNFDKTPIEFQPFQSSKNTSVLTDPSQQEIIHSIYNSECKVIQGPPGTGKSQSLTAIITNGLENLKRILVVCEKKTALEVIENNLKELGLGELCVTIDDVNRDRKKVIDRVRKPNDVSKLIDERFYDFEYNNKIKQFEALTESYNAKHHQLLKPLLNNKNIKQLIGQSMELQRRGFELRHCFYGMTFDFSDKEYGELSDAIQEGGNLLDEVHEKHFAFDKFLKHRFASKYTIETEHDFFSSIEKVEELMEQFIDSWEALTFKESQMAENYQLSRKPWTKVKALFSTSTRIVIQHWKATKVIFDDIKKALKKHQLLPFEIEWNEKTKDLSPILKEIKELRWLVGETMQLKPRFRNYFLWRHFYEQRFETYKTVIRKLREIVPNKNDWLPVFQLEYINRLIEQEETKVGLFNIDNLEFNQIKKLQEEIRTTQKDKILSYWIDIRHKSIRTYNRTSNVNWLYNYRRNKVYGKANSLRKIVKTDFDLFSNVFPVLLVNPTVCSSLLPLEKGLFDLVIFDEASQLRLEDTFAAFYRGKTKVISGDKQQMPPSSYFSTDIILEALEELVEEETSTNQEFKEEHPLFLAESESLLAFGNNLNMEQTNVSYLDFHYRSKHPHLIDFSNAAFYGKRLVPLPPVHDYQPIRFIKVDGIYQDAHNLGEAKKIIEIIRNEIQPIENGEFPTLGIATFNLKQRNIIKNIIYDETIRDEKFRLKMEAIGKEESWFVKNLENVQGDERDIIIISTTFGINGNGRFIQNFGPINNYEKGYKLLNVIITRAKKQLYILTSIPEEKYNNYQSELEKKGNKGKAIFYAYLDYCRTVEQGNEQRRQEILRLVARNSDDLLHYELPKDEKLPQFEQEIFRYLSDYVQPQFIEKKYPLGGYRIDFVIKDKENNPIIAIECDGTDWHNTEEAYIYDIHRQNIIEGMGLKYHRIWSRNWFPNPNHAAFELVAMIADTMPFVMEKVKMSDYSDVIDDFVSKLSEKNEN